jgi:phosphoribosylaminoimidazole (AIR) synthetase
VQAEVGFVLEVLPEPQPIFTLLQEVGRVSDEEMFCVYNMGTGFCLIVAAGHADRTLDALKQEGIEAFRLGHAVADPAERFISSPGAGRTGSHFLRRS